MEPIGPAVFTFVHLQGEKWLSLFRYEQGRISWGNNNTHRRNSTWRVT